MCAQMDFTPKYFVILLTVFALNAAKASIAGFSNSTEDNFEEIIVSPGETAKIRVNVSGHEQAAFIELTGETYNDKIRKISAEKWQQTPFRDNLRQEFVNLTHVGSSVVEVSIRAENDAMGGIYQVFAYNKGAGRNFSSKLLKKFMLIIQDGILPNRPSDTPHILTEVPRAPAIKKTGNQGSNTTSATPDVLVITENTTNRGGICRTGISALYIMFSVFSLILVT